MMMDRKEIEKYGHNIAKSLFAEIEAEMFNISPDGKQIDIKHPYHKALMRWERIKFRWLNPTS